MGNMLEQYPEGIVAVVSDSYDIFNAIENLWGKELKELIKKRKESGGKLVIRPDSGDPVEMVPKLLQLIKKAFEEDCEKTEKGFWKLPPYVGLIQGDGISYETVGEILKAVEEIGFCPESMAFGSGGALLQ